MWFVLDMQDIPGSLKEAQGALTFIKKENTFLREVENMGIQGSCSDWKNVPYFLSDFL